MTKISCLVISYSRIEGVNRLLSSLNPSEIETLYLAVDGPDSTELFEMQRDIVHNVKSFCEKNGIRNLVWQRKENLGVAKSIISAVDWFFSYEEFGMILEDDLLIGKDFVGYLLSNRNLLSTFEDLLLISGNQFADYDVLSVSRNWTSYPLIWGWATSRDKWYIMREGLLYSKQRIFYKPFSKVVNFWRVGSMRVRSRQIDTWDIPLAYYMFHTQKLCLLPDKNLVSNLGNDAFASHTQIDSFPLNLPVERIRIEKINNLPNDIDIGIYDSFLESQVFLIKKRHALLYLYFLFLSILRGNFNWKKLGNEIEEIILP